MPARAIELSLFYEKPLAPGRGVAKALLRRIEAEARAAGTAVLRLETGVHQPEAVGLYARVGFRPRAPFGHYAEMPARAIELSLFYEKRLAPGG
jgi:putative acetyltransferase